jgi:hypothetical protein
MSLDLLPFVFRLLTEQLEGSVLRNYSLCLWFIILGPVTAPRKCISASSILLICTFANIRHLNPYRSSGLVITLQNFNKVCLCHFHGNVCSFLYIIQQLTKNTHIHTVIYHLMTAARLQLQQRPTCSQESVRYSDGIHCERYRSIRYVLCGSEAL